MNYFALSIIKQQMFILYCIAESSIMHKQNMYTMIEYKNKL